MELQEIKNFWNLYNEHLLVVEQTSLSAGFVV